MPAALKRGYRWHRDRVIGQMPAYILGFPKIVEESSFCRKIFVHNKILGLKPFSDYLGANLTFEHPQSSQSEICSCLQQLCQKFVTISCMRNIRTKFIEI